MSNNYYIKLTIVFSLIFYYGCETVQGPKIFGCSDSTACNYELSANVDDGSCYYETTLICYNDTDNDGYFNENQEESQGFTSCNASCSDLGDLWFEELLPAPKVMLSASPSSISVGDIFSLDVEVANIENLFGISFKILFDPTILIIGMESEIINYTVFTNENFGPVIHVDSEGILSVAIGGDNLNGKIFSIAFQGSNVSEETTLALNEVNLIQEDGAIVSNYSALILENTIVAIIQSE